MKKLKIKLDYRHFIMIALILGSLAFIPFFFPYAHLRIAESAIDLVNSGKFYINELLDLGLSGELTINEFTKQPFELPLNLPRTWEEFAANLSGYWITFFSTDNFSAYMSTVANVLLYITNILLIIMPLFLVIFIVRLVKGEKHNNDYGKETKALKAFKWFEIKVYKPIEKWFINFFDFVKTHTRYLKILAFIWLYSFNGIAVIISFIAYYLYFITALNTTSLYIQLVKLLMDASVMINFIPVFLWVIIGLVIFHRWRCKVALKRLNHYESHNRAFIDSLPVVSMIVGTMGKNKTKTLTDMALSQTVMFRDEAFELMLENDLKFPNFPWISFVVKLKEYIVAHDIFNLATCRLFIDECLNNFLANPCRTNCFDYDYERYGLQYDNKLYVEDLFDVLYSYTRLFYIYVHKSSLLISNYSIREDQILQDVGNFPMWDTDFFNRDSRLLDSFSRHSHILDFDMLRLGKKMIDNNKNANIFEFGVIVMTEGGKERGNQLDTNGMKADALEANQKNDRFDDCLKLIRHSATIDYYPFARVFMDEQRPESMGANVRELCSIIHIEDKGKKKLALPFFFVEELLHDLIYPRFKKFYSKFCFNRGDTTLFLYLFKKLTEKIHNYYKRTYNLYSYSPMTIATESGTLDGKKDEHTYYLMDKKAHSKRYDTACFSDIFEEKVLNAERGLNDLEEYQTVTASSAELDSQHSYFYNKVFRKHANELDKLQSDFKAVDREKDFWKYRKNKAENEKARKENPDDYEEYKKLFGSRPDD